VLTNQEESAPAYAYDVANLARFLEEHEVGLAAVEPMDVFAWVDWQGPRTPATSTKVVRLGPSSAAPATINRRVASVRAFFEFLVMSGIRESNPVPAPRRGQGCDRPSRGMLGHLGPGRPRRRMAGP
jgi:integrase/recombinase XerC